MDCLKNKKYYTFDYISRYAGTPAYYNTIDQTELMGLTKNMLKNNVWVAHKVKPTDSLDSLALTYYNNPTYWWVIAYFNNIQDAFISLKNYFEIIKIPALDSIQFGDLR